MADRQTFSYESQKARWIKYGANVVLTVVVVIVLAQRTHRIIDTRASTSAALKPQTVNLIGALNRPVKIVSLYSSQGRGGETRIEKKQRAERKQAVEDLLKDYKRYGKNIDID